MSTAPAPAPAPSGAPSDASTLTGGSSNRGGPSSRSGRNSNNRNRNNSRSGQQQNSQDTTAKKIDFSKLFIHRGPTEGIETAVFAVIDPEYMSSLFRDSMTRIMNKIATADGHAGDVKLAFEMDEIHKLPLPKKPPKPADLTDADKNDPEKIAEHQAAMEVYDQELDYYKVAMKAMPEKRHKLLLSKKRICNTLIAHSSEEIVIELKNSGHYYTDALKKGEAETMLELIRGIMYEVRDDCYLPLTNIQIKRRALNTIRTTESVETWVPLFMDTIKMAHYNGVRFGAGDPSLIKAHCKSKFQKDTEDPDPTKRPSTKELEEAAAACEEVAVTTMMIDQSGKQFDELRQKLRQDFLLNQANDNYPKTKLRAHRILLEWEKKAPMTHVRPPRNPTRNNDGRNRNTGGDSGPELVFAQDGSPVLGRFANTQCTSCNHFGHNSNWTGCPRHANHNPNLLPASFQGQQFFMSDFDGMADYSPHEDFSCCCVSKPVPSQSLQDPPGQSKGRVNPFWILLDSQSTIDMAYNPALLSNIRYSPTPMRVHCNGGIAVTHWIGDLKGHSKPVWFHPNGVANILSLESVEEECDVDYTRVEGQPKKCFVVTKKDGSKIIYIKSGRGLHYMDVRNNAVHKIPAPAIEPTAETETKSETKSEPTEPEPDVALVTTVEDKKSSYTVAAYNRAENARKTQNIIGRPRDRKFVTIVENNQLRNCPVTRKDIAAAVDILGPNLGSLKGKTVRLTPKVVEAIHRAIPPAILERYGDITFGMDIMYTNGIRFLVTISKNLQFGTIQHLTDRFDSTKLVAIKQIKAAYDRAGFKLHFCNADGEFESLRTALNDLGITLNTAAENEHVPEVERYIRTIKERVRATYNTLPFKKMPPRMLIELVYGNVFWLNAFPADNGVSDTLSPRTILTGQELDYNKHVRIEPGAYVQTHEDTDNTMKSRTVDAIALRPTGNAQGSHYFLSLQTGRRINRNAWTELPMPNAVIEKVHRMARQAKAKSGLAFQWADGSPIDDDNDYGYDSDEDSDYEPPADDDISTGVSESGTECDEQEENGDPIDEQEPPPEIDEVDEIEPAPETEEDLGVVPEEEEPEEEAVDPQEPSQLTGVRLDSTAAKRRRARRRARDRINPISIPLPKSSRPVENTGVRFENEEENENRGITESRETENMIPDSQEETPENGNEHSSRSRESAPNDDLSPNELQSPQTSNSTPNEADSAPKKETVPDSTRANTRNKRVQHNVPWKHRSGTGLVNAQVHTSPYCTNNDIAAETSSDLLNPLQHVLKPRDYCMFQAGLEDLEHFSFTQYYVKKGIKMFGQKGIDAVSVEAKQIHDRDVLDPKKANMLTEEEKKNALEYLMFLKQKRCGKIKGRGCADGRKQRVYKTKEETSSPTVTTEALFLSCVIDALEGRDVATVDIPGAFMQAAMDEEIHVRFSGPMATLLAKVDPSLYDKYITYEKGQPAIYCKLKKALYGTLQAALLFWKDLTSELQGWGFELNPYDTCVANKMINGKQCTILWHVDDLKISHVEHEVVTDVINKLRKRYATEDAPLTENRTKIHDYLGMELDYSIPGKVVIRMDGYIQEILDDAREDMDGVVVTPAAEHLFMINENPELLNEADKSYFHTMTAKLLFVSKRARPDLQEAVSFLTTRVKAPDQDDYKKLARVIKYLRGAPKLALTLEAENLRIVKWWVDASFAIHPDMRSHTGGTMTLGKGSVYSTCIRQKLNTKSSTEAELVGVDDLMPMVLWTRYFLEAQGHNIDKNVVYQDNMSSILLEKNGRASSGKRTRHINIRYFFVADRIKAGEVSVEYCPTDEMRADYFTKPLQGIKFYKFRKEIMNLQSD